MMLQGIFFFAFHLLPGVPQPLDPHPANFQKRGD